MEETIYEKIKKAVTEANITDTRFEDGYPRDHVRLTFDPVEEEEERDTLTPLVTALETIAKVIKEQGTLEDDIEVTLYHLPSEESWGISIGDGR